MENPYGRRANNGDFGTFFNTPHRYWEEFGVQPCVYYFDTPVASSTIEALEKMGAERLFSCDSERQFGGHTIVSPVELCFRLNNVLVYLYRRDSILSRFDYLRSDEYEDEDREVGSSKNGDISFRCKIFYPLGCDISGVLENIERRPEKKKKGNVHLLCSMEGMLALQRFEVKLPSSEMDLEANYGSEVALKFNKLGDLMSSDKGGLVLFSGDPGTGKSTFIKHLTTQTTRKVIYLSSGAAEQITNPDFLSFIMGHRNCILLLEDAEKVLRSRETQDNSAISNILNITDGILGDCLNIMVIATFNIEREMIDPALVRKGRLLMEHHFKALDADAANRVLKNMGSDRRTSEPMTLAEIYNSEDNFHKDAEEKKRVGF